MSKQKQIVEIARVLNECCNEYDEIGRHLRNKCFSCEHWSDTNHCCCSYGIKEATALYEAGYRKASDIDAFVIRLKEKLYTIPTVYNAHFSKMVDAVVAEMKGEGE